MAKYVLVYHGGSMPEGEAAQAAVMTAWEAWFQQLGGALVDGGNPASATKVISSDGSVTDGNEASPTGYSIISAGSHDEAVSVARGCPVLAGGGTIEVVQTFDAM
jgi:hypothetical protein